MKNPSRKWHLWAICAVILVVATGCFQDVRDTEQPNAISQFIPSETPTETPTEFPTETPTETPEDLPLAETETPTPTLTETPSVVDQPISDGQEVAQAEGDAFSLTATQFVLEVTQTAEFSLTQTAIALGIGATPTPDLLFPTLTPTLDPFFQVATPTQGVVQPGGSCVHEIVAGENLFRLSIRYGVSVNQLAAASGIANPQLVLIGERITIPGCGTTGVFPPPTSMPTTDAFGTGGSFTDQSAQVGGTGLTGASRIHIVEQYETLYEISLLYGVSVNSLAAANGITNINVIIMGDELVIPAQ